MRRMTRMIFFVIVLFNTVYNAFLPLHPDEAYYWVWTRHLALSYYDHPPMVAYFIKAATLIGDSEMVIRLVSVICLSIAGMVIYKLAHRMFCAPVAERSLFVFLAIPLTQIGFTVVTPDAPLVLFWALTLYCAYRAIIGGEVQYYYATGITSGLMLLSKYTGVVLLLAIGMFIMFSGDAKKVLKKKEFFYALLLMVLIFSPVVIWNWRHDWISFKFQLAHGVSSGTAFNLRTLFQFVAGQAGIANPIFFAGLVFYTLKSLRRNLADQKLAFLFWPTFFTLGFFGYAALFKKSELNWAAPAYISGSMLLAYWLVYYGKKWLWRCGCILTVLLIFVVRFPEAIPNLPAQLVLNKQVYGYNELFYQANQYLVPGSIVLSDSYQNASLAQYYLKEHPCVYVLVSSRFSNYDMWRHELDSSVFHEAVYFGSADKKTDLDKLFKKVETVGQLRYSNQFVQREYSVFKCYGYNNAF